ncbi:MAG: hypothetical protein KA099_04735 [Alphaproteobacteria bacterium]|nr:hypothetical protein [Alphaproteobacteria bacterium]MBP7759618.1 hypothetical protein [Alphaproteobacteria bacterium]MBP7763157.1 hypothetical protein [Alphaproteobacteria bacterium]MBP7904616.1 hypothetical protein [Alphaproteobacteria bacterium]
MCVETIVRFSWARPLSLGLFACCFLLCACQTTSLSPYLKAGESTDSPSGNYAAKPPPSSVLDEVASILEGRGGNSEGEIDPEELLEAEGNMNMVEQTADAYDPAAEHLKARKHVDTNRKTKVASLTPHFDPDISPEKDNKFRVLKIQKGDMKETKLASAVTVPERVPERITESVITFDEREDVPEDFSAAPESFETAFADTGVVVPGRKPPRHGGGEMLLAALSAPALLPERKPDIAAAAPETLRMEDLAAIEPAAGLSDSAIPPSIVPPRKPPVPVKNSATAETSAPVPPPRPKTSFMAVNLTPMKTKESVQATEGRGDVIKIRSAEHEGKTRVVLDIKGDARFEAKLDNGRKALLVDLENAGWSAGDQVELHTLSIVSGFTTEIIGGGATRLILNLKKDTKLLQAVSFGTNQAGVTRIVIDLKNG